MPDSWFTIASMPALAAIMPHLKELALQGTYLRGGALASMKIQDGLKLEVLTLGMLCHLGSSVWTSLVALLERSTALHTISLYECYGSFGHFGRLAAGLAANTSIRHFDLDRMWIDMDVLPDFRLARSLETLRLSGVVLETTDGLHIPTSLKELDLSCNYLQAARSFEGLNLDTFSALVKLSLRSNRLGAEGAVALGMQLRRSVTLRELDVGDCGLRDAGLLGLKLEKCVSLVNINAQSNNITDEGVLKLRLKARQSLRELDLRDNPVTASAAATVFGSPLQFVIIHYGYAHGPVVRVQGATPVEQTVSSSAVQEAAVSET